MKPHPSSWSLVFVGPRASARIYRNAPRNSESSRPSQVYAAVPKAIVAAKKNAERRAAPHSSHEAPVLPLAASPVRAPQRSLEPLRGATDHEVDALLDKLEVTRSRSTSSGPKYRRSPLILPPTRASDRSAKSPTTEPDVHVHAMTRPSVARHEALLDKVIVLRESGVSPRRRRREFDTTVSIPRVAHARATKWLGFARVVFCLGVLFAVAALAFVAGRS